MARGTDIGKAYVQIVPSAEGISGSISNVLSPEIESAGGKASSSLGNKLLTGVKWAAVGATVGKVIGDSIAEGADLQQSFGGLETIYGEAADAAKKYAVEASKVGISANTYAEQAVSFGASLKQAFGGDTTKAIEAANVAILDMTDNAAKMGTPIESIQTAYQGFAKQNYTMLDNLKLGYGGTKTEMQRLLKDAQKLSGVKYDISNLGDVYDAIHVIQQDLGLTGVAAQEAKETFSGSFEAMKASASNLMASLSLGEDIQPALQQLIDTSSTFLFDNFIPMIGNVIAALPGTLLNGIQQAAPLLMENGAQILLSLCDGIINNLPTLALQATDIILSIATTIVENFPLIIEKGFEIVTNLAVGIIETLPQMFTKILDAVKQIHWLDIGKAIVNGIIEGVKSMISTLIDTVVSAAAAALDAVKDFLDINSPSKKYMDIGKNMALGLSVGYEKTIPGVVDDINKSNKFLTEGIESDVNATINPNNSRRVNNIEVNFKIDNSGKDITDNDVDHWSDLLVDRINERLGMAV